MAKDFVFEIGTEEIPAKFAPGVIAQLNEQTNKMLKELRLAFKKIDAFMTPRRMAVMIRELDEKQADLSAEVKGPAVKAAYDAQGAPTKAAQGFARGQGVSVEELFQKEVNGVPYVFAKKAETGLETKELLARFCLELISSLHFPKPMRWGDLDFRFARPIRWLAALYGSEVISFEFAGLQSGRESKGHRTLSQGPVIVEKAQDYIETLRKAAVIVDQNERTAIINGQIKELAQTAGGVVLEDEELLSEITHLVEYPTALLGEIASQYMNLPEAVLTTPMREHQRYFPVHSQDGKLLPYFITVRNGDSTAIEKVKAGNEKVLKARLEDAAFYYREDKKKPLDELVPKLDKIVYHEKLGTVRQRVERLRGLARYISKQLGMGNERQGIIDRTAYLAKADLVTLMVYDFPELQGIMGADYAAASGEAAEVCQGIVEHYQPRFAGDELPASEQGKIVSIADKLDAIVGAFGIGIQPTGSQDPYALRRQAQGIISIMLEGGWDLSLDILFKEAYRLFADQGTSLLSFNEILPLLEEFFQQRLRYVLQEQGIRYDVIDAAIASGSDSPYRISKKAKVIVEHRGDSGFVPYIQAYVRCSNLTKKQEPQVLDAAVLEDEAEIALAEAIAIRKERFDNLLAAGEYVQTFRIASEIVPLIEALFEAVMIMVENEKLKKARLALLSQCVEMLGCIGDLSMLVS